MGSDFERAIDRDGDRVVGQRARHMGRVPVAMSGTTMDRGDQNSVT